MRYEGKHSYFKSIARNASFKNLPKLLATRHQNNLGAVLLDDRHFCRECQEGADSSTNLAGNVVSFAEHHGLSCFISWVQINGVTFCRGSTVACGVDNDLPVFGEIMAIARSSQKMHEFVVKIYNNHGTSENTHAYMVTAGHELKVFRYENFIFYEPLATYMFQNTLHVPIKVDFAGIVDHFLDENCTY